MLLYKILKRALFKNQARQKQTDYIAFEFNIKIIKIIY